MVADEFTLRSRIVELVCQGAASSALTEDARALVLTQRNIVAELLGIGFPAGVVLAAASAASGVEVAPMTWLRNPKVGGNLDPALCRQVQAAPVAVDGGWLCIAYADPELALRGADLGFPPHQPYLAAPMDLRAALTLLDATATTTPSSTASTLRGSGDVRTVPIAPILPPLGAISDVRRDAEADRPRRAAASRSGSSSDASTRPSDGALRPPRPFLDVTGGTPTAERRETSGLKPAPQPRTQQRGSSVPTDVAVPPRGELSGPKERPLRGESSAPKPVSSRVEVRASTMLSAPTAEPLSETERVEGSQPKTTPSRSGSLVVERASELRLPEPKPLPMPPKVTQMKTDAARPSSGAGSVPTAGAFPPSAASRKFEPLDPVVEASTARKGTTDRKAAPSNTAGAVGRLVSETDTNTKGALEPIELDAATPSSRSAALFAATAIAVAVGGAYAVVFTRPFDDPPRATLTVPAQELAAIATRGQEQLLRRAAKEADHVGAIDLCDQVIDLDRSSPAAHRALLERARRRMALSQLAQANAELKALRARPGASELHGDIDASLAEIARRRPADANEL